MGLQQIAQKISSLMLKLGDWATGTKLPIKEIDHQGQNASKYYTKDKISYYYSCHGTKY